MEEVSAFAAYQKEAAQNNKTPQKNGQGKQKSNGKKDKLTQPKGVLKKAKKKVSKLRILWISSK